MQLIRNVVIVVTFTASSKVQLNVGW